MDREEPSLVLLLLLLETAMVHGSDSDLNSAYHESSMNSPVPTNYPSVDPPVVNVLPGNAFPVRTTAYPPCDH